METPLPAAWTKLVERWNERRNRKAAFRLFYIRRWLTFFRTDQEIFREVIKNEPFGDEYEKTLMARRLEKEKLQWTLFVFNMPLLIFFAYRIVATPPSFSVFGITFTNPAQLAEVLLVVSASLAIVSILLSVEIDYIGGYLDAMSETKVSSRAAQFHKIRHAKILLEFPKINMPEHAYAPWPYTVWAYTVIALIIIILIMIISFGGVVHVLTLWQAAKEPAFPPYVTYAAITYVAACDLLVVCLFFLRWLPLPYTDFHLLVEFNELKEKDPAAYRERLDALLTRKR